MALTRLASKVDATAGTATRTLTLGSTPTAGKRLVLLVVHTNAGSTTVKDTKSNTWQLAAEKVSTASPIMNVQMYTCNPLTPLVSGDTLTITHSATTSYAIFDLYEPSEYLGNVDSGVGVFNTSGSTSPSTSLTPVETTRVTIAATAWGSSNTTISQPSGWSAGGSTLQVAAGSTSVRNLAVAESSTGATTYTSALPAAAPWVALAADFAIGVASNPVDTGATTPTSGGGSLSFCWTGVPYTDGQWITTQTSGATGVRIKYATNSTVTTGALFSAAVAPDADGYAKHHLSGLTPNTDYWYQVEVGGALASPIGKFHTNADYGSFSFAFGSCLGDTSSTAFDNAAAHNPELFIHLGDWAYADNTSTSVDTHRGYIESKIRSTTGLRNLIRNVPTAYLLSDHDSGTNDWRGGPAAWTPSVNEAYRQVVPNQPVTTTDQYWSFVYKGVRFIMTDSQSHSSKASNADNSSKTMFGSTQKAWIKQQLSKPEKLKVLCVEGPWVWKSLDPTSPKWNGYNTERAEIGKYISDNGIDCFVIHGDQHCLSADDGTNAAGGQPVFGAAPFGGKTASHKGGPYSEGQYPTTESGSPNQHGIVTITNASASATSITAAFKAYTTDNTAKITYSKTFAVTASGPAAPVDPNPTAPGSGGSSTPPPVDTDPDPDPTPTPTTDGTTIIWDGSSFVPGGQVNGTTASSFIALGSASVDQWTTDYASAPTLRILNVNATTAAAAVANGVGATFSVNRAGTWQPKQLTFNVARGGATSPRGIVLRSSADNYTANLYANTDITAQRPSWESRTVDLTQLGTVSGTLTFRMYMYAPASSASVEVDDLKLTLDYTESAVPPGSSIVSDSFTSSAVHPWTVVDNGSSVTPASFVFDTSAGAAEIIMPATPLRDYSASLRNGATVMQAASGDFDVAVHVNPGVNGATSYRGVGLLAQDASLRDIHVVYYDTNSIPAARFNFAYGDTPSTETSFGLTDYTAPAAGFDLRFKRAGNAWSFYTSENGGSNWTLRDTATATFQQTQVGFYAVGSEEWTASVSSFRNLLAGSAPGVSSNWSLFHGSGISETVIQLEGMWNGSRVVPLTVEKVSNQDVASPTVSVANATSITTSAADMVFTTNEPVTAVINYGTTEAALTGTLNFGTPATSFTAHFSLLQPNTTYYTRVTVTDLAGNSTVGPVKTFTTAGGTSGGSTDPVGGGGGTAQPQVVGGITINQTQTSVSMTFTTDIPAARKLNYRAAGTGTWSTNMRTAAPGTTHTMNIGGLTAGTTYNANLYLANSEAELATVGPWVYDFSTAAAGSGTTEPDPGTGTGGSTGGSTGGGTTTPPPSGTGSTTKLRWAPPKLTNPTTVQITDDNRNLKLDKTKDYIIQLPKGKALNGGLTLWGGHHVVIIGGQINASGTRALYLQQATGTTFVEGVDYYADAANPLHEGCDVSNTSMESGAGYVFQNMISSTSSGTRGTYHSDWLQIWAWAKGCYLRVANCDVLTGYQGFMLQPDKFAATHTTSFSKVEMYDSVFRKTTSGGYLIFCAGEAKPSVIPWTTSGVTLVTTTGSNTGQGIYPESELSKVPGIKVASSAPSKIIGNPGHSYVSPGYQS